MTSDQEPSGNKFRWDLTHREDGQQSANDMPANDRPESGRSDELRLDSASKPSPTKKHSVGKSLLSHAFVKFSLSLLFVVLIAFGVIYYGLAYRSFSLTSLKSTIEETLSREMSDLKVQIGAVSLRRKAGSLSPLIFLEQIRVSEANEELVASVPGASIQVRLLALLTGSIVPTEIDMISPKFNIIKTIDGGWSLFNNFGPDNNYQFGVTDKPENIEDILQPKDAPLQTSEARDQSNPDDLSTNARQIGQTVLIYLSELHSRWEQNLGLEKLGIQNAEFEITSGWRREYWYVPEFALEKKDTSVNQIEGSGWAYKKGWQNQGVRITIGHKKQSRDVSVALVLKNIIPAELSNILPLLRSLGPFEIPISGTIFADINLDGAVKSGQAELSISPGTVSPLGLNGPAFRVEEGQFVLQMNEGGEYVSMPQAYLRFPTGEIKFTGDLWQEQSNAQYPIWLYNLQSVEGYLSPIGSEYKQPIDELAITGRLFGANRPLSMDQMRFKAGASQVVISGGADPGSIGNISQLRGTITEMPIELLKAIWPVGFYEYTRSWIQQNVTDGKILAGEFSSPKQSYLIASGIADQQPFLPVLDFRLVDIQANIASNFPAYQAGEMHLNIRNNQLELTAKRGHFLLGGNDQLHINDGRFYVSNLEKKFPKGEFDFSVKTDLRGIEALHFYPPFKGGGINPDYLDQLNGIMKGKVALQLHFKEQVTLLDVRAKGDISSIKGKLANYKIDGGTLGVDVTDKTIDARGKVILEGVSTHIRAKKFLKQNKINDIQTLMQISGTFDEADRNKLGWNINHFVGGPIESVLTIIPQPEGPPKLSLSTDLTSSEINFKAINWRKEKGRKAEIKFDIEPLKNKETRFANLVIDGEDLAGSGWAVLNQNKRLKEFFIPKLSYKVVSNLSLSGLLDEKKIWHIKANGSSYDGKAIFQKLLGKTTGDRSENTHKLVFDGINLEAQFKTVLGGHDTQLQNVSMFYSTLGKEVQVMQLEGDFPAGGNLRAKLVGKKDGVNIYQVESQNAGDALRLINFYPNIHKGQGRLVLYDRKTDAGSSKFGELYIRKFSILGDPVVKEVLADLPASEQTNTQNTQNSSLNNKGQKTVREKIYFDQLKVPFTIGKNRLTVHESFINGPLLGATIRGSIDYSRRYVSLNGTYIPLFSINSMIGAVPVIGDLLVGRQGEGMLGITFGVFGRLEQPQVLVNPMSLVAPGVLRQIFEFSQGQQAAKKQKKKPSAAPSPSSSASPVIRQ